MIRPRNRVLPVPGLQALWLALENVAGGASWLDRSGNGYQYVGKIHWAGVWNRVLTPAEMFRINRVFNL